MDISDCDEGGVIPTIIDGFIIDPETGEIESTEKLTYESDSSIDANYFSAEDNDCSVTAECSTPGKFINCNEFTTFSKKISDNFVYLF